MNKLPMRYLLFIKLMMVFVLLTVTAKSQIANKGGHTMSFSLSSPAFEQGNRIPTRHTCEGEDTSPFLQWSAAPEGTKSFALSCFWTPMHHPAPGYTGYCMIFQQILENWTWMCQNQKNLRMAPCRAPAGALIPLVGLATMDPVRHQVTEITGIIFVYMPWIQTRFRCRLMQPGFRWKRPWLGT